jgi:hypothetical protein
MAGACADQRAPLSLVTDEVLEEIAAAVGRLHII